jgi:hypothetical protein
MPQVSHLRETPDTARELMFRQLARISYEVFPDAIDIQDEIVDTLSSMTGTDETDFVGALVRRLALSVGGLAASESNHHAYEGGLLHHSLEVGLISLELLGRSPRRDTFRAVSENGRLLWTRGLAIAALFHDIGKIQDFRIQSQPSGEVWHPEKELLAEFVTRLSAKDGDSGLSVEFEKGRGKRHEVNGRTLLPKTLPASISDEQCSHAVAVYDSFIERHDLARTVTTWPLPILAMTVSTADGISCDENMSAPIDSSPSDGDDEFLPDRN